MKLRLNLVGAVQPQTARIRMQLRNMALESNYSKNLSPIIESVSMKKMDLLNLAGWRSCPSPPTLGMATDLLLSERCNTQGRSVGVKGVVSIWVPKNSMVKHSMSQQN